MTHFLELKDLRSSGRKAIQVHQCSIKIEKKKKVSFVFSAGSPKPPVFDFPYASGNDGMPEYGCEDASKRTFISQ